MSGVPDLSRRALLAAATGAIAATAIDVVARPGHVLAAGNDGANIVIGGTFNDVQSTTSLKNVTDDDDVFSAVSTGGGHGLYGESNTQAGVYGVSTEDAGVQGSSTNGVGVYGQCDIGFAVQGNSSSNIAVYGQSNNYIGVYGLGSSVDQPAVVGHADQGGLGVVGYVGPSGGPLQTFPANTGVTGIASQSAGSVAVRGQSSTGRGGVFKGKLASVRLTPSSAASHPTSGQAGDLFVDASKRFWFCKGGSTWVKLA